jgi:hypothetical protein
MVFNFPEEIRKLQKIYKPYRTGGAELDKNAPAEAIEARKQVLAWMDEQYKKAGID